jgi:hypothetical protein
MFLPKYIVFSYTKHDASMQCHKNVAEVDIVDIMFASKQR